MRYLPEVSNSRYPDGGSGRVRYEEKVVAGWSKRTLKPRDRSKYAPRRNTPKAAR